MSEIGEGVEGAGEWENCICWGSKAYSSDNFKSSDEYPSSLRNQESRTIVVSPIQL